MDPTRLTVHIPSYPQTSPPPTIRAAAPLMSSLRPPVLHQLHCIDRSKSGFSDELNDVLNDEEYQRCVPELQGDHLVWLVDSLDKVSQRIAHPCSSIKLVQALDGLDPSNRAFRKCLRELRSICSTRGILPTSYTISSDLLKVGPNPSIPGGFGDVYEGSLDNSSVSIKRVRIYDRDGPEKATKVCYWRHSSEFAVANRIRRPSAKRLSYGSA